jgi:cytochrome b involved in lipid metabolism
MPITEAEVAKHTTQEDCWVIIEDRVYDILEVSGNLTL